MSSSFACKRPRFVGFIWRYNRRGLISEELNSMNVGASSERCWIRLCCSASFWLRHCEKSQLADKNESTKRHKNDWSMELWEMFRIRMKENTWMWLFCSPKHTRSSLFQHRVCFTGRETEIFFILTHSNFLLGPHCHCLLDMTTHTHTNSPARSWFEVTPWCSDIGGRQETESGSIIH